MAAKIHTAPAALNGSHWGAFEPVVVDGRVTEARPFARDPDPSQLLRSIPDALHHHSRVAQPSVRTGWLEHGPGGARDKRGADRYVPVSWELALDLIADEIKRVIRDRGNQAIYAGSYGWGSAGRFHHARTQLQRFLGGIGGYTGARDTYSNAAGAVLVKNVLGSMHAMNGPGTSWKSIADHADLVVMFGGMPTRNTQVTPGGMGEHTTRGWLEQAKAAGVEFCNISPMRDDAADFLDAEWIAPRPHSDTALMLALSHTLIVEGLQDADFLARYCVGFSRFRDYLLGAEDGVAKSADWAASLSEISADRIRDLARRMAASRTFINVNWSLQRGDHGEQPIWAAITLGAVLGQVGLPGGGFGFGYGSMEGLASLLPDMPIPTLSLGHNPIRSFIPVARIADLLLNPGQPFQYNGQDLVYPDIDLVYWCGGNPFHHHQDLNRLIRAWRRPSTIVVHDPWWTATARHADIVLPTTTTLERDDIGASARDRFIIAMKQAISPVGEARDDFEIFSDLAHRFGTLDSFAEGRTTIQWLRHIYEEARARANRRVAEWPDFDEFWRRGYLEVPEASTPHVIFEEFRMNPDANPLPTSSGRIEIFSEKIASYNYADCPGHPTWLEPAEWLGSDAARRYPLHLLTTQPRTRLHGQMDMGCVSQQSKVAGREPMRINRADACARGIHDGDVVKVFNDRGAILAGAVLTDDIRPGVIQISTGAWYDPLEPGVIGSLDKHGNPNVLTLDKGTSSLAQGPSAQTTLVQVEKYVGEPPPVSAFMPPIG
ncbi:MAG TPA: molybdopterin-dependent oxidoreductase [Candidatus Acidoferrales bacterium]|nr:molybdopterin-dependent oxidoreductase [Candidatus Acidoferrales bacterium]